MYSTNNLLRFSKNDVKEPVKDCVYYRKWYSMLARATSFELKIRQPCYLNTEIDIEWLRFSNFKNWCISYEQKFHLNIENCELDKDIIGLNIYSPKYCLLIPHDLNTLFSFNQKNSNLPLGVTKSRNKFRVRASFKGKRVSLGSFDTKEEAHKKWQESRIEDLKRVINDHPDPRFHNFIKKLRLKIENDLINEKETTSMYLDTSAKLY